MDVDINCELRESHIPEFLALIGDDFYSSELTIRDAICRKSCFNLIHLPTSFKVDVFVSRERRFDLQVMSRAQLGTLGRVGNSPVPIATPEDVIILKLEWYRLGGEVSERQWNDVSRLVKLLGNSADFAYLKQCAEDVGVADLWLRMMEG
jgi:hypothetical protein